MSTLLGTQYERPVSNLYAFPMRSLGDGTNDFHRQLAEKRRIYSECLQNNHVKGAHNVCPFYG